MPQKEHVKTILDLYKTHGHIAYGEGCSVASHSVQAGLIAKEKELDEELILAAFLHDVGHISPLLLPENAHGNMGDFGIEHHEQWGETYLSDKGFSDRLIATVKNHVASKRYLCFSESGYYDALSFASKKTLGYQGGPMTESEAKAFESQDYFEDSIVIRQIDDEAKHKDFDILMTHWDYFYQVLLRY